jgi:hypothetical protein
VELKVDWVSDEEINRGVYGEGLSNLLGLRPAAIIVLLR